MIPEQKQYIDGGMGLDGRRRWVRAWTTEEWEAIPPDRKPDGCLQIGRNWMELVYDDQPVPLTPKTHGRES